MCLLDCGLRIVSTAGYINISNGHYVPAQDYMITDAQSSGGSIETSRYPGENPDIGGGLLKTSKL